MKPKFGDHFLNIHASDKNPHKFGFYVETITRTGIVNRGKWFRLTDKKGKFWQVKPDALVYVSTQELIAQAE